MSKCYVPLEEPYEIFLDLGPKMALVPRSSRRTEKPRVRSKPNSERREHASGVRLWDDKDPRADQSFFLGGVPGSFLRKISAFLTGTSHLKSRFRVYLILKRGMDVSDWYKVIDNFRRVPNREAKMYGENLIPITDRERVVYLSPVYGRMVFMKIMSPILDRMSGRIIGWNITLNVNSVSERVKFFEDLYHRIDQQSRHTRYVVGTEQLLGRSASHHEFLGSLVNELEGCKRPLIVGAVKAEFLVEGLLERDEKTVVTVVDADSDALRLLKSTCGRFKNRVRLVRREWNEFGETSFKKFDAVAFFYPRFDKNTLGTLIGTITATISPETKILLAGYSGDSAPVRWWEHARSELAKAGHMDVLKWHWQTVSEEDQKAQAAVATLPIAPDFAMNFLNEFDLELSTASYGLLAGNAAILVARTKVEYKSAV